MNILNYSLQGYRVKNTGKEKEANTSAQEQEPRGRGIGEMAPGQEHRGCLLYTSPSPRDTERSRMPSSA